LATLAIALSIIAREAKQMKKSENL